MNTLNKIISTIVVTAMLSLPVFAATFSVKVTGGNGGKSTTDVSWNS